MSMTAHQAVNRGIPDGVKREVRQRCGFGCVICGLPLYEYDHMEGFAIVHRHVAEEIVLLCARHHAEVTSGLLPRSAVAKANKNPFNLRTGTSAAYPLHFGGTECEIWMGTNSFSSGPAGSWDVLHAVVIDGVPLLAFTMDEGQLLLSAQIHDDDGNLVLLIEKNEMLYSTEPWDISLIGRTLTIRRKSRDIILKLKFDPDDNRVDVVRGRFGFNGVVLEIDDRHCAVLNNRTVLSGCSSHGITNGLVLGDQDVPGSGMFRIRIPYEHRSGVELDEARKWFRKLRKTEPTPPAGPPHRAELRVRLPDRIGYALSPTFKSRGGA
jgi:hypothetical protein